MKEKLSIYITNDSSCPFFIYLSFLTFLKVVLWGVLHRNIMESTIFAHYIKAFSSLSCPVNIEYEGFLVQKHACHHLVYILDRFQTKQHLTHQKTPKETEHSLKALRTLVVHVISEIKTCHGVHEHSL